MKKIILFLLILYPFRYTVNKGVLSAAEVKPVYAEQIESSIEVEELSEKIETLSEKVGIYKDFSDKIIEIFIGFLSIIVAVIIVFLGINWFGNNKKMEERLKLTRQELLVEYGNKEKEMEETSKKLIEARKKLSLKKLIITKINQNLICLNLSMKFMKKLKRKQLLEIVCRLR
jgi:hypothetical protein